MPTTMNPDYLRHILDRRRFLARTSSGLGVAALASLFPSKSSAARQGGLGHLGAPHEAPKAKRVIYLFQSGGPSHLDLFDYKPVLQKESGKDLPESVRGTQRVTLMTRNQSKFLSVGSPFKFTQHGQSGAWFSELLPHMAEMADHWAFVNSVASEPINHDTAVTFMQTGRPQPGLPAMGSWMHYGLGTENSDLPAFVVMLSGVVDQPILSRYYHSGFLPSKFQGVQFQSSGDPVLFLSNPKGMDAAGREAIIDGVNDLNRLKQQAVLDPEIQARIDSFELAFRMQSSVPDLIDVTKEPKHVLEMYGPDATKQGTYAYQCLIARRLAERGVRFIQLFHTGWDQHGNLPADIRRQTKAADQPTAALLKDLEQRGMLDDTLIVWGGEFGRTSYCQGEVRENFGRDHHPRCFTVALAGGGIKGGTAIGKTDDYGYNIVERPVEVHDLHATILHCLGIDHERLTFNFQGRDFRLTDVAGRVVREILG